MAKKSRKTKIMGNMKIFLRFSSENRSFMMRFSPKYRKMTVFHAKNGQKNQKMKIMGKLLENFTRKTLKIRKIQKEN
jgi:hypothetical protein